jgi:hypothetical protein
VSTTPSLGSRGPGQFNPADWYWSAASDPARVYSSKATGWVAADSPDYLAWVGFHSRYATNGGPTPDDVLVTIGERAPAYLPVTAAQLRYAKEVAGVTFAAGGGAAKLYGTDRDSQSKISAAFGLANAGHWVDGTPWKTADGSFAPLAAADVVALAVKVANYIGLCYANEARLSADPALDISTGWPSNA